MRLRSVALAGALIALLIHTAAARAQADRRDGAGLTCRPIAAMGLHRYTQFQQCRSGGLARPQENEVWDTYLHCRKQTNRTLAARLPPTAQARLKQLRQALEGWERSYIRCIYTETFSESIGGSLVAWSAPAREDAYARVISVLLRSPRTRKPGVGSLRRAFHRADRMAEFMGRVEDWARG